MGTVWNATDSLESLLRDIETAVGTHTSTHKPKWKERASGTSSLDLDSRSTPDQNLTPVLHICSAILMLIQIQVELFEPLLTVQTLRKHIFDYKAVLKL